MHYLLETARALHKYVCGTPSSPALVQLRAACENAFREQEVRRMRDKEAVGKAPAPTAPRANQTLGGGRLGNDR